MEVFRIEYDRPTGTFAPGETVIGRVIVENREPIKAKFLKVSFNGLARTGWSETEGGGAVTPKGHLIVYSSNKKYSGAIDFLSESTILWKATEENRLPAGTHAFPFSFTIPADCRPSYVGEHGSILYTVNAEFETGAWKFNKKSARYFIVKPVKDLNLIPNAVKRWECSKSINTGMFFKNGVVSMTVNIPKVGYVAGEIYPMTIDINNDSKLPVVAVRFQIKQYARFFASRGTNVRAYTHTHQKLHKKCVAESKRNVQIAPKSRGQVVHSIEIPNVVQSFTCPVITLYYSVSVKVDTTSAFGATVKCYLPLIIGTIPIEEEAPSAVMPTAPLCPVIEDGVAEASVHPTAPSEPQTSPGEFGAAPSASPSYEKSMSKSHRNVATQTINKPSQLYFFD